MKTQAIKKPAHTFTVRPNLPNYEAARARFSWADVYKDLDGLPGGVGLNIAHEAVDRHADGPLRDCVAIRWLSPDDTVREFTYAHLKRLTNRFANLLKTLDIQRGDRICTLCDRIPDLYIAALGTFKYGGVFCPLFSAFGPEPVFQRLSRSRAAVLITTERLFALKVAGFRHRLPHLKYVLLTDADRHVGPDTLSLPRLFDGASDRFSIPPTDPNDMAILHFTSGTTGFPKGAVHVHDAVRVHYITGKYVLDLRPGDIFWCTADPGWVTGTAYGIIAPLVCGVTSIVDGGDFDAGRWFRILESQKVTVWYTAPTAIRRLMRTASEALRQHDLSRLRHICSVGEPLAADAVRWGSDVLGHPIHDTWWQTENGGIMIANYPSAEIRPGSMGLPLPGIEAAIVRKPDGKTAEVVTEPDVTGHLALRSGWPSMFRGYLGENEKYAKSFSGDWYLSGDLARRDADGYFWFVGRGDDIIKTSGHMVGPFEVESVLTEHPAVAEAGVIGLPDPMLGERVAAFVSLRPGMTPDAALHRDILGFARKRLGPAVAPREIVFQEILPKNRAGKVMRRLLKARRLGLPQGDTSTPE
ncbi:acetate--CoA ligase [Desulfonema ishimotonii]|uniref:acetate--CoA ligase n=1 Tax=Desulfonema ishimotonii TaxID=45657 RepID=A0A401FWZ1_9BACT|nr:acetate--CoA ligase [Desulfonema ishimotonii]GBC61497.1 acetate--CoA ligase [Desulfonema ishimotonii]